MFKKPCKIKGEHFILHNTVVKQIQMTLSLSLMHVMNSSIALQPHLSIFNLHNIKNLHKATILNFSIKYKQLKPQQTVKKCNTADIENFYDLPQPLLVL